MRTGLEIQTRLEMAEAALRNDLKELRGIGEATNENVDLLLATTKHVIKSGTEVRVLRWVLEIPERGES